MTEHFNHEAAAGSGSVIPNRQQLMYAAGKADLMLRAPVTLAISGMLIVSVFDSFSADKVPMGLLSLAAGAAGVYVSLKHFLPVFNVWEGSCRTDMDPETYPLQHVDSIRIDDTEGLEMLLQKARIPNRNEWGTFFKTRCDGRTAVIERIIDPVHAKRYGLVKNATDDGTQMEFEEAAMRGYSGDHHNHPLGGARNLAINPHDRHVLDNWISLLTFNMPDGPEIIGYNRRFTYIPKDDSKRELVRATPKDIMRYLKKYDKKR